MPLQRAAIFGGTFDPVHNGHLEAARRVQHLFAIDRMIFVPACVPPHKRNARITSAFHRFAMLALATESESKFEISTVELEHPDRPYAVETVSTVQKTLGSSWRIFFIMGADSWGELTTWHDWQRLLTLCTPIVVTRPGHDLRPESFPAGTVVHDVRGLSATGIAAQLEEYKSRDTFISDAVMTDVSATAIRSAIRRGDGAGWKGIVPQSVAAYIEKHHIYKN